MTKRVRIENADTSSFAIVVEVWDDPIGDHGPVMASKQLLRNPADLFEAYIHDSRRMVVREARPEELTP